MVAPDTLSVTLLATAACVAVAHTALGPDHFLPFVMLSRARGWSRSRTLAITAACGVGHVGSSLVIALAGVALGAGMGALEEARGQLAAWAMVAFGVAYGLSSHSTLSGLDDQLDSGNPPLDSGDPRFADGRRAARNANIAYAAAGVAAIAGAVLTWHALRTEHTVIVPRVTSDGAAVSLEVTW